ncbi:MAG: hypothetical protein GWN18_11400, partial [Thermoplasmata archaeon]|nr:hypothetical protein [Thermoplasmata archaeon]NIS12644.1 hypothetical protein [Thermoplasmata archaeon]NIS20564.1 hypothetical protein [Thermoplasmata archaeon]NIT77943.1 hypothetical protein [Thermoplasmata archaeon]NIU49649.1 hypothetical protein [Thermoplasmata archaeon]
DRLVLILVPPEEDPRVGVPYVVDVTVRNEQDRSIQMALVELVAPVGMSFDHDSLDGLLDEGIVNNVEYEDDMVR